MKTKTTFFCISVLLIGFLQLAKAQNVTLETSTEGSPKWYILKSAGVVGDTHDRISKIITYMPNSTSKGIKGINLNTFSAVNDSILWRFEADPTDATKVKIISKYDNSSISSTFEITAVSTSQKLAVCKGATTTYDWTLSAVTDKIRGTTTYKCYSFTNALIVAPNMLHMGGSGIQWWFNYYNSDDAVFFYLLNDNYFTTTTTNVTNRNPKIYAFVSNRKVCVTGSNLPVRVFSIDGRLVNAEKELSNGVYIVKVGDYCQKVSIN